MIKNYFPTIFILFLFQGCTQFVAVPEGYNGPVVTLWDNVRKISSTNAHYFELISVDGRSVNKTSFLTREKSYVTGFAMNLIPISRNLPVISKVLIIGGTNYHATDIFGIGDLFYNVKGAVNIRLKAGNSYKVNGEISKHYSLVWVEDDKTGLIVSNVLISGKVPADYISKLNSNKVLQHRNNLLNIKLKKQKQIDSFQKAREFSEGNGCDVEKFQQSKIMDVFLVAEILFQNKIYQQSRKCFELIAGYSNTPRKTYKYLFLIYDVGLGIAGNRDNAEFWKTKFEAYQPH
jgi:hypothetical protein